MPTTETDKITPDAAPDPPADAPAEIKQASTYEIAPEVLSLSIRRSGRLGTRLLAILSLLVAIGAAAYFVTSAMDITAPTPPIEKATSEAWSASSALSDSLRALRPGASREPSRPLATAAAKAVKRAQDNVEALTLSTSETPLRARVLAALRADAAWVDAVGSTLANPRSARRAELAGLAKTAATAVVLIQGDVDGAEDSVGGTGRLLSATK